MSTVDVDRLIDWATETAARFPWASWVPDRRDWIVVSSVRPPLTFSMVVQYASLRAWLDGQDLTRPQVDAVTNELAAAWWNARMTGDYRFVADVLRDVVLWNAVIRMPKRDREYVRTEIVARRRPAAAPPMWAVDSPNWPAEAAPSSPPPSSPPTVNEPPGHVDVEAEIRRMPLDTKMYEVIIKQSPTLFG
jgi:hypothetical protein